MRVMSMSLFECYQRRARNRVRVRDSDLDYVYGPHSFSDQGQSEEAGKVKREAYDT